MMHGVGGGFGGMHFGFFFFQLLIFIGIFVVVWWLLKDGMKKLSSPKEYKTPLAILKARLAKGEITVKEFERLKKEIE